MNFPTSEETTKLHIKRVHKNTGYGKPIISIMFLINIYNQKKYSTPHFSKKKKKKKKDFRSTAIILSQVSTTS